MAIPPRKRLQTFFFNVPFAIQECREDVSRLRHRFLVTKHDFDGCPSRTCRLGAQGEQVEQPQYCAHNHAGRIFAVREGATYSVAGLLSLYGVPLCSMGPRLIPNASPTSIASPVLRDYIAGTFTF